MRVLVLGGTWFLGRALAEEARRREHTVSTFSRGRSGTDLPGVHAIRGDRQVQGDLARLARQQRWDVVIDTSGEVPRTVLKSVRALADRADRYVFISSVSAYEGWPDGPLSESCSLFYCPPDAGPEFGCDHPTGPLMQYRAQKAGCERAVTSQFGGRELILRPGVLLGPREYVGRLPWWLRRMERGGPVLAPGNPDRLIQPIDARDVASFAISAAESGLTGAFNVVAPRRHATYGELLARCIDVGGFPAELVWVDDGFLLRNSVREWTELPLWRVHTGSWQVSAAKARAAGLLCRPLHETVRDTWSWLSAGGTPVTNERQIEHGLSAVRERELLRAWAILSRTRPSPARAAGREHDDGISGRSR
jgi:2'-hydroxyisoflavone reductase